MNMETYNSIEVTKQLVKDGKISQEIAETIFPELKESEDERISREIISYIKSSGAVANPNWIAWLEKKGEQKPAWNEEDEKMIGRIRGIIEQYAFSQSAVDVNGELCEREFVEPDEWLKSLKKKMHLEAE